MNGEMHVAGQLTALGWAMFALYLVAAGLAFRAAAGSQPQDADLGRIWRWLGVVLAMLGFNKPLDLQTRLIELGRWVARQADVSASLPELHVLFFVGFILLLTALFAVVLCRWRIAIGKFVCQCPCAASGCGLVCVYIVIRAMSIDRVDQLMCSDWEKIPFLWLMEAGGLMLIIVQGLRGQHRDKPGARSDESADRKSKVTGRSS